jgi:hypothetical protein
MQKFPLDDFFKKLDPTKEQDQLIISIIQSNWNQILFLASIKRIKQEFLDFENLIFQVLKPTIDALTKKNRRKNSFRPSEILQDNQTSKPLVWKDFVNNEQRDFIQMVYVNLFHKIENAENELLHFLNNSLNKKYKSLEKLDFLNTDKDRFPERDRLREVANSFKHRGAIVNNALTSYYPKQKKNEPLRLGFRELRKDFKAAMQYIKVLQFYLSALGVLHAMDELESNSLLLSEMNSETMQFRKALTSTLKKIKRNN